MSALQECEELDGEKWVESRRKSMNEQLEVFRGRDSRYEANAYEH